MRPTLYIDIRSPPVRTCLMLIKLLDIDVDLKEIDLFKGEQLQDQFKQINPAHTVPTLIDDDLILTDSKAILIHFCERYQKDGTNKTTLWPQDYKQRMQVLNMLLFEGTVLFRRDSDLMFEIVRNTYANTNIDYHQRQVFEVYGMLEQHLTKNTFIATENMTIADLAVVTTLSTVDLIIPVTANKWPLLFKWFEYMKTLTIYDINCKGLNEIKKSLEIVGKFEISNKN